MPGEPSPAWDGAANVYLTLPASAMPLELKRDAAMLISMVLECMQPCVNKPKIYAFLSAPSS